jgi:hypothetical protein
VTKVAIVLLQAVRLLRDRIPLSHWERAGVREA